MIWFLHGMLGTGSDLVWKGSEAVERVDLWEHVQPFDEWTDWFCDHVRRAPSAGDEGGRFLVGYSMGGRLALHALKAAPQLWKGVVIISAHPGLEEEGDRRERLLADAERARAVRDQPWAEFLELWEGQPVFTGSQVAERRGLESRRDAIALAFNVWSLGRQSPMQEFLRGCQVPALWITGELDQKFRRLAERGSVKHEIAPGCGHRVPLDNPKWLERRIRKFMEDTSEHDSLSSAAG